jgi:hypothetical protein
MRHSHMFALSHWLIFSAFLLPPDAISVRSLLTLRYGVRQVARTSIDRRSGTRSLSRFVYIAAIWSGNQSAPKNETEELTQLWEV